MINSRPPGAQLQMPADTQTRASLNLKIQQRIAKLVGRCDSEAYGLSLLACYSRCLICLCFPGPMPHDECCSATRQLHVQDAVSGMCAEQVQPLGFFKHSVLQQACGLHRHLLCAIPATSAHLGTPVQQRHKQVQQGRHACPAWVHFIDCLNS